MVGGWIRVSISHARFWDCTAIRIHAEVQNSCFAVTVGQRGELTGSRRVSVVRTADFPGERRVFMDPESMAD
jgi:hypothetical protein